MARAAPAPPGSGTDWRPRSARTAVAATDGQSVAATAVRADRGLQSVPEPGGAGAARAIRAGAQVDRRRVERVRRDAVRACGTDQQHRKAERRSDRECYPGRPSTDRTSTPGTA